MLIPKPLRKFIAVFRGDVSPTFIFLSVALGFWFGLTPGWSGVHVALLVVALVLNIHAGTFILLAGLGKALCYAAAPLLYHAGCWSQAHLGGLFDGLASLPIVGITDFDRCAVAGATVLGPTVGLVAGFLLARGVLTFRRLWLKLDENSEVFRAWQRKAWVRWLDWFLIGKRVADAKTALAKKSHVIRVPGVIVAVVIIAASAVGVHFVQGDRLRGLVAEQLTKANGAEVSLAALDLAPFSGRVSAKGIQVTDPADTARNRIQINELTADTGLWSLLCGRLVIDDVVLGGVVFDEPRETPGVVVAAAEPAAAQQPRTVFDPAQLGLSLESVARLVDYYRDGKELTQKLESMAEWLPEPKPQPPAPSPPQRYLEYLTARGTVTPTPLIVVRRAVLDDVRIPAEEVGTSTITCQNLSDAPQAAGLPIVVQVDSKEKATKLKITCHYDRDEGGADIEGTIGDVDLKQLQARLSPGNPVQFEGGTASATLSGKASRQDVDLRLAVETQGMQARTAGKGFFGLDPQVADEALKVCRT